MAGDDGVIAERAELGGDEGGGAIGHEGDGAKDFDSIEELHVPAGDGAGGGDDSCELYFSTDGNRGLVGDQLCGAGLQGVQHDADGVVVKVCGDDVGFTVIVEIAGGNGGGRGSDGEVQVCAQGLIEISQENADGICPLVGGENVGAAVEVHVS